ncbi:hypothetical protein OEZ86_007935 [Tetradesmus obliquus]|nr:hypothetical protein OEZ86_007935 [Tetradesmus obliquus]
MSLVEHCLATLADHIDRVPDLSGVPEHLIAALFALVLERGRLTPRVLAVFQALAAEVLSASGHSIASSSMLATFPSSVPVAAVLAGIWRDDLRYWNDRYAERSTHFDWFFNYSALASLIRETCERKEPCLHVGCGNSGLSEGMVHDGYQVINVDISGVVIEQMRRMSSLPGQSWEVADCRSMPQYSDASFGSVLDKGTLDAVLCSSHGQTDTVDYMNEVHRLLAPGGTFLLISLGQPHARLAALNVQQPPVVASCSAASGSSLAAAPCSPGSSAGSLTLPYLSETYRAAHAAAAAALAAASGKPASSYSWTWESVQVYLLPKPSLYLASEQSLAGRPSTRTAAHSDKDQPVEWLGPFAPGAELEAVVAEQGLDLAEYFTGFACKKRSSDEQQAVCAVPEGGAVVLPVAAAVVAAAPDGPIDEEEAGSSECIAADQPSAAVPGDAAGVKA